MYDSNRFNNLLYKDESTEKSADEPADERFKLQNAKSMILDIGCGTGSPFGALRPYRRDPSCFWVGLEIVLSITAVAIMKHQALVLKSPEEGDSHTIFLHQSVDDIPDFDVADDISVFVFSFLVSFEMLQAVALRCAQSATVEVMFFTFY